MKTNLSILLIIASSLLVNGQNPNGDFNPYVRNGDVIPSPLWSVQENGVGIVNFEIGNTGSDPLDAYADQFITLTLTLSYGEPDSVDPVDAVTGTAAGLFSWSYSVGTYTAKQITTIPADYNGIISIAYRVKENSSAPGINGFNVNISPAPYQTNSNSQADDAVSFYTYTDHESREPSAPTGLSLVSVSEQRATITWNASSGANGIESYKVYRDSSMVGGTVDLTYTDSTVFPGVSYLYAVSAVDSLGYESEYSEPLSVSSLSMSDFEIGQILIIPNPTTGLFQIDMDNLYGEFILEIVSASGSIVLQRTVAIFPQIPMLTINNEHLENGIYTVRLYNQSRILFGKLIIIKQ